MPFPDARTQAELLRKRLNEPVPSLRLLRPEVPASLDEVLARSTAKDPADRYLTVDEMVIACRTAIEGRPSAPPTIMGRATLVSGVTRNPYKGLRAFQEADAEDFFGRQRLVERLVARFAEAGPRGRLLTVVGPSGSGKSSVVRAGLLPAIRRDAVPGSSQWFVTSMVPGTHPFEELEVALRRLATGQLGSLGEFMASDRRGIARAVKQVLPTEGDDLLLVIDQFEELFTLCADDAMRRAFIDGLVAAVSDTRSRLRVVLTLRADFYDRPLRYADLAPLVESGTVAVSPLTADELERAIVEPADRSGATFEPGLVARIIADFVDQPGALPLLQYAMTELFDDHVVGLLTIEAYERLGGLTGVLGRRAEGLYSAASAEEQAAAQRVMIRLVSLGEGTEDTRRRVRRSELGSDASTGSFVDSFGDARLLSFDHDPVSREPTVEVAHEALIREWPRLRGWLDEDRDGLRVHRHLTEVASEWVAAGRDEGELLRGARLETTEAWADSHDSVLNDVEREFLVASSALHVAEVAAEVARVRLRERQNRRLRRSLVAVGLVAAVALLASGLAVQQRERANTKASAARRAAFEADTGRIQSEAAQLASTNPRVALLLAAEAHGRDPGPESLGALQQALVGSGDLLGYFKGGVSYGAVEWIDAHHFAAARSDGVDIFRDDGTVERSLAIQSASHLAVSSDGRLLAVSHQRDVAIVDLQDRSIATRSITFDRLVQALDFSSDGSVLGIGTESGTLVVLDSPGWKQRMTLLAHPEHTAADLKFDGAIAETVPHVALSAVRGVSALAFDDTAQHVATAGFGYARVWDISTGRLVGDPIPLTRVAAGSTVAAVPRSMGVVMKGTDVEFVVADQFKVWRIANSGALNSTLQLEDAASTSSTLDAERSVLVAGRFVVTAVQLGAVAITDIERPTSGSVTETFLLNVRSVALEPGGDRLLVSSADGLAVLSTSGDGLLKVSLPTARGDIGVSNDGAIVGAGDITTGHSELWRVGQTGRSAARIKGFDPRIFNFTPDDRLLALSDIGRVRLVDMTTFTEKVVFRGASITDGVYSFALSADGRLATWATTGGTVGLWSVSDGTLIREFRDLESATTGEFIRTLSFDPKAKRLLAATSRGRAVVWNLATGASTFLARGGSDFVAAIFSPDGRQVATLATDGAISLRDATSFQPTGKRFAGNTTSIGFDVIAFTPDGKYLHSAADGRSHIWDVASGSPIGGVLPSDPTVSATAAINARWVVTGHNGRMIRWDLRVERWLGTACRAAGRNMTMDEWSQYGPAGPYHATCSDYPETTLEKGTRT